MSADDPEMPNPVKRWVFLTGNRELLATGISVGIVALTWALVATDVIYVGPGSNLAVSLSSGLLSGLLTLITVALTVNQLILSRVFGPAPDLFDRVDRTIDFRERVEHIAEMPVSPNDPDEFLTLIGNTLADHAQTLREATRGREYEADVEEFAEEIAEYGKHIAAAEGIDDPFDVLMRTLGTRYAMNITEGRRVQTLVGDDEGEVSALMSEMVTLLKSVAAMRQFYKTLALQQDLARLSRRLIYTGLVAVLVTYYLSQVYTASPSLSTTLPPSWLPLVTSVGAGVIFSPLVIIISHLLRIATVALYTASAGPFVPPLGDIK